MKGDWKDWEEVKWLNEICERVNKGKQKGSELKIWVLGKRKNIKRKDRVWGGASKDK